MRLIILLMALLAMQMQANAQKIHLGIYGGAAAYAGELSEGIFPKHLTHPVYGLTGNYELSELLMVRAGVSMGTLEGADRYSKDTFSIHRNLSFKTKLTEFSLLGEFYLVDLYQHRLAPYIFAGLAVFHYDPYAFDRNGQKTYLRPLSTEGEGIPGYANVKPYRLTSVAIPFGGGVKFALNDDIRVGLETGIRKLSTDYLDDVSSNYISEQDLLAARGQKAVDMAFRGNEIDPARTYPAKGAQRGGSKTRDYYYFAGLHLSYRLGAGNNGTGRNTHGKRSKFGCPANVSGSY